MLRRYHARIAETLAKGDDFEILGIGRFRVKDTPARIGRNPRTGESIEVLAGRRIAITPSSVLKNKLNMGDV